MCFWTLYQTSLEIHLREKSGLKHSPKVSVFQDITNLYISGTLSCVLGQSLVDYHEVGNAR